MAEEAIELVSSVQYDASTGFVTSVDTAKLARLNAVLMDNESGSSMIATRSELSMSLPMTLVRIINSSVISVKNRFAALSCLVSLSRCPDEGYRQGVLFPAVSTLDSSFEGLLLDKEESNRQFGTQLGRQHEQMVILLFRCTGYAPVKAADLLEQLCSGNDVMLANLLLNILRVKSHEWPLINATMRCLFELSLPLTYFTASDDNNNNVTNVTDFQTKVAGLLIHSMQGNTLKNIGDELSERWGLILKQPEDVVNSQIPYFATALKYYSGLLLNLEDFCDQSALQKTFQQSFLIQLGSSLSNLFISFVMTAISSSSLLIPAQGETASQICSAMIGAMKVLRLAFYKPQRGVVPSLISALFQLTDAMTRRIVVLRQTVLIPVMLLHLEVLANVDAAKDDLLAGALQQFLASIAEDGAKVIGDATLCQALSTLFLNESSVYVVMENETTRCITAGLCGAALDDLVDEIIKYIDKELILLGVGPSVFEFFVAGDDENNNNVVFVPMPTGPESIPPYLLESPMDAPLVPETSPNHHQRHKKKKKSQHPSKYVCMLSGKLMREPVVIKQTGNWFELEELEKVMESIGHVDPITGEAFEEDPEVDMRLQQEIQQYKVLKAATKKEKKVSQ